MTDNTTNNDAPLSETELDSLIDELQQLDDSGKTLKPIDKKQLVSDRVSDTPPPPPSSGSLKKEGAAKVAKTGAKYDQLRKNPSMSFLRNDDMQTLEELSDVVAPVSKAIKMIEDFERKYKGFYNEQKLASYRTQLRETSAVMLSEFYSLRKGRQNKTYDPSKICKICHAVFMVKLPANRICDQCKSAIKEDID